MTPGRSGAARATAFSWLWHADTSRTSAAPPTSAGSMREREDIKRPSCGGVFGQVRHRIDHAERGRSVARIARAGNHRARPAAAPGQHRDILMSVGAAIAARLAHAPAVELLLPDDLAVGRGD